MLLHLGGAQASLTPRGDGFVGGRVVVRGRAGATIASVEGGINWAAAKAESLLINTDPKEWAALKAKAGTAKRRKLI